MKKLFTLFTAILFAGSMMAAEITVTKTVNQLKEANGWEVSSGNTIKTIATNFNLDDSLTVSTTGTANCGSIWGTTTLDWRLYQAKSGDVTIATKKGYIKSVTLKFSVSNNGCLKDASSAVLTSNSAYTVDAASITFTVGNTGSATNGQVKITEFKVVYDPDGVPADVAKPAISGDEFFYDEQDITITCKTANAKIYYTLDGTEPSASSTEYAGTAFKINATTTVKAIAIKDDKKSAIVEKKFTKNPSFASFDALVTAGLAEHTLVEVAFENVKVDSIYLNSSSKRYGIYFAVNEKAYEIYSNKDEISAEWVAGGTIAGTIRGDWYSYNGLWELVPSASDFKWSSLTYTPAAGTPEKPTFSIPGGIYTEAQSVELGCETDGAEIFYTLDGAEPTSSSTKYTAAIAISETTTIKAIAIKNFISSIVVSETYTIVTLAGEGTKEKPYTVGDVIKLENSRPDTAWVAGYIVGGCNTNSGAIDNTTPSAIALGETADATTYIPVQLVGSAGATEAQLAVRAALNVKDTPGNIGVFVKVRGALEKYVNRTGVKGTCEYEIIADPTSLDNTAAETKAVKTIVNGQLLIEKDGKFYNVLGTVVR